MHLKTLLTASLLLATTTVSLEAQGTRLLRRPTVSHDNVAFEYGGDLWVVARAGGSARRLTSTPSAESDPQFSPDGSLIAYSATISGNTDVYVVPTVGGEPKRLTWHPGADFARGWTPDGKRVEFASSRGTLPTPGANSYLRIWTVGLDGGSEEMLPLPRAFAGTYSADGKRLAYAPLGQAMFAAWWAEPQSSQWRRYRGGRVQPIRIVDLATLAEEKLPWTNSNDSDPMWVGNTVYFLSDRDRTVNLYSYEESTKKLTQLTHHDDFDIMAASASSDAVVYEQAGYVHLVDLKTGQSHQLNIEVLGDFPWAHPQMKNVSSLIADGTISPTGARAAFEARGDIFTIAADGSYRDITQSSGAHDRNPAWSPDGKQLAWISDESGEFQLMIGDQTGGSKPRAVAFPTVAYYAHPVWAPNAQHMLFRNSDAELWTLAVGAGRFTKIDTDWYDDPQRGFDAAWSPDSRWVAYSKSLPSHLRAIFLYSRANGKSYQITDGMADAISPAFDASGKYLYFLASTNYGLKTGWLDLSSEERYVRRSAYLTVLSASEPSPLIANLVDEPGRALEPQDTAPAKPARTPPGKRAPAPRLDTATTTRIDLDGIQQRILPLAIPPGDYANLVAGSTGTFFFTETPFPAPPGGGAYHLWQYRLADKHSRTFVDGISAYAVSADTKKMLFGTPDNHWSMVGTDEPPKAG
ncbi:MAG TPA: protease, partial [Gemmatimonadaceae bacterium]|nr:protease [Gemmatimonadaceae bacterium]